MRATFPQTESSQLPQSTYAAIVHKEGDLYFAECSEVGTVSQGKTVEEAMANLREATELHLEEFPPGDHDRPLTMTQTGHSAQNPGQ